MSKEADNEEEKRTEGRRWMDVYPLRCHLRPLTSKRQ